MRHLNVFAAALSAIALTAAPVFGEITGQDNGAAQVKNVQTGAQNASTGWVEIFDSVYSTESKSKNTAEKFTGFIAGAGIGARKALHKTGAGLIDLGTFWMPKKDPLLAAAKDTPVKHADKALTAPTQNFTPRKDGR